MSKKEERAISKTEKAALFVIALVAFASWFSEGVAWYQPLVFFLTIGGLVVWIGDAVYKRQMQSSAATSIPDPAPSRPKSAQRVPSPPRSPRYSSSAVAVSTTPPDVSSKSGPGDVLVCLHGLDEETSERLERLCVSLGFATTLQASGHADMAVVGPDSVFDFAAAGVHVYAHAALSDVLYQTLDQFAIDIEADSASATVVDGVFKRKPQPAPAPQVVQAARHVPQTNPAPVQKAAPLPSAPPTAAATAADVVGVYRFLYKKSDGSMSHRRVKILRGTFTRGAKYFGGVCLEANTTRTFRVDRVAGDLTHEDSGEMFGPDDLYAFLQKAGKTAKEVHFLKGSSKNKSTPKADWATAVFFAGFRGSKLHELEGLADAAGWQVRGSISHTVNYVVRNGSAGKRQLAEAEELGIDVIDEEYFRLLM